MIYKSYKGIDSAIARVASHYQYDVVLRYSREQNDMDPKKPQTVNFGIQRDILYHNAQIDITEIVLGVLKSTEPAVSAPASPAATPAGPAAKSAGQPLGPKKY